MIDLEKSYGKAYLGGFVHRARLKAIVRMLRRHVAPSVKSWADFGCASGFVIESVMNQCRFGFERIVGFDGSREHLTSASDKGIANTDFQYLDLNHAPEAGTECFELVTCFETLEHVSDYRLAFKHLFGAARAGGLIVVTVPNETGLPGLTKLWVRPFVRRQPYGDFFTDSSLVKYTKRVVTGAYIDDFRKPSPRGYGPHLGFDFRRLFEHIEREYLTGGRLVLVERQKISFGMNVLSVYRKCEPAV